jgi:tetratricopeptide (TPR) repeat protein
MASRLTASLIPTDARLGRDFDVEDETISLDRVLRAMDSARRLRLVILDACRDNPFAQSMKRSSRAIGRGLARVEPTTPDTLVAFAAKAGSTASDGDGANSPFTAALLKHIATPGLDIRLALGRVYDEVMETTRRRQEPFVYGSLGGRTVSIVDALHGSVPAEGPSEPPSKSAMTYITRGNAYHVKGEFDRAIADYNQAIELNPKYAHAYKNRGSAYESKGDYERAQDDYRKVLSLPAETPKVQQAQDFARAALTRLARGSGVRRSRRP